MAGVAAAGAGVAGEGAGAGVGVAGTGAGTGAVVGAEAVGSAVVAARGRESGDDGLGLDNVPECETAIVGDEGRGGEAGVAAACGEPMLLLWGVAVMVAVDFGEGGTVLEGEARAGEGDGERLWLLALGTSSVSTPKAGACVTASGATKIPRSGLQEKYRTPFTKPPLSPTGRSSSTPTHMPRPNSVTP